MPVLHEQTPVGMGYDTELRGPRGIRHQIAAFAREFLPDHIAAARAVWGLSAEELPAPLSTPGEPRTDAYFEREPGAIDRWPLLAVTSGRRVQKAIDWSDDGQQQFTSRYPVRIYVWVKAEGWDETQNQRDDLATVVQAMVLARTMLGTTGQLAVQPSTVVTDFSTVVSVKGDRFVAGAYVGFDVAATETLTDRLAAPLQQPRDTVSGVITEGLPLPSSGTP